MTEHESFGTEARHGVSRVEALLSLKRYREALSAAAQAIASSPESLESHYDLARAHLGLRQYEEARQAASRIIQLAPEWAGGYYLMSIVCHHLFLFSQELEAAERCAHLAPDDEDYLDRLARAQIQSGLLSKARVTAEQLLKLAPENADTHVLLADIYIELDDYTSAEPHVRHALNEQPDNPVLHNDLGRVFLGQKQWREAIDAFLRGIKIDAGEPALRENLQVAVNAWIDSKGMLRRKKDALSALPKEVSQYYEYEQSQRTGIEHLGRLGLILIAVMGLGLLTFIFSLIVPAR